MKQKTEILSAQYMYLHTFSFLSLAQTAKLKTEVDNLNQEISHLQRDNKGTVGVLWSEAEDKTGHSCLKDTF